MSLSSDNSVDFSSVNQNNKSINGSLHTIDRTSPILAPDNMINDIQPKLSRIDDLWVDSVNGNDFNDGLTFWTSFQSIQKAADLAGPGTTVHILPGVYRETVEPMLNGTAPEQVAYIAENGIGTVTIRGSEPSSDLGWTQLKDNTIGLPPGVDHTKIYYTDLSDWNLDSPPRFIVELDDRREVTTRLPLAREPDWSVATEWKYHEFWWAADGGTSPAPCNPATNSDPNCDYSSRSIIHLTDRTNDPEPPGMEAGNLTTLGDLTGATLVAIDTVQGHYVYRRKVINHDIAAGRVTLDRLSEHNYGTGDPGLGWGTKYYIEGKPYLLDNPGEWWFNQETGRLYLWPTQIGNPVNMNLEISRRENGFILTNSSFINLDGLIVEFLNETAIYQHNYNRGDRSISNTVSNVILRYANRGLWLTQWLASDSPSDDVTDGFTFEYSEIANMDSQAIHHAYWWEGITADNFVRPGITNTTIRYNELHHIGFRSIDDEPVGARFIFANQLRFEDNHIHNVAHSGVHIMRSIVQSSKSFGFEPLEIKTSEILIKGNIIEKACQLNSDCGALKIFGSDPEDYYHIFRNTLIIGNIFRDTFGWTYILEKRGGWNSTSRQGMAGNGLYIDAASGIYAYRNIAYNNSFGFHFTGVWRDGEMIFYNNIGANNLFGFFLSGDEFDSHESVNTQVVNNIIINNEGYGVLHFDGNGLFENMVIDHNLYFNNGWRPHENGGVWKPGAMAVIEPNAEHYYLTQADIQANSEWENNGVDGNPAFRNYDITDHDLHDGSWADFHIKGDSFNTIDRGTIAIPDYLVSLLNMFGIEDHRRGLAFDIGRYELGSNENLFLPIIVH